MSKPPVRLQRANYLVSDLREAYRFYIDVLGFSLCMEKDSEPDSYSYPVFGINESSKLRFAILDAPTQPRVMALTEVPAADIARKSLPRLAGIVLDVDDIDRVVEGSIALGLKVFHEDALETHDGRHGREVGILDFDDNLTVIYHIPAA